MCTSSATGFTERLFSMRPSYEGYVKALASNFADVVNPADVFLVRAVSDAFGVERLAI